ncbi:hypothetical protein BS47DRAFT_1353234, partial [Hydnum rufescens UP504]
MRYLEGGNVAELVTAIVRLHEVRRVFRMAMCVAPIIRTRGAAAGRMNGRIGEDQPHLII